MTSEKKLICLASHTFYPKLLLSSSGPNRQRNEDGIERREKIKGDNMSGQIGEEQRMKLHATGN